MKESIYLEAINRLMKREPQLCRDVFAAMLVDSQPGVATMSLRRVLSVRDLARTVNRFEDYLQQPRRAAR